MFECLQSDNDVSMFEIRKSIFSGVVYHTKVRQVSVS
jgi:hypothetical protein